MTRKLKKVLALLLTLSMVMSMVTVTSLAAEERTCPLCKLEPGKWKTVVLVYVPEEPATCQKEGVKAHYMCPECQNNFHRNVGVPNAYVGPVDRLPIVPCDYSVPATCTSNATCKWCGAEDPNGSHDPNNHVDGCTLGDWIITVGEHYKEYSLCGAKESAHAPCEVGVSAVPATCLVAGTTAGTKCSTCGVILSGVEVDPQKDHSYVGEYVDLGEDGHAQKCVNGCDGHGETVEHSGNWVVTKNATCTAKGEETQTCVCGHVTTRETNMLDHKDENKDNVCDDCGATICDHAWEGVQTKAPNYKEEGEMEYTCSKCGATKTESIAKLVCNHDHEGDRQYEDLGNEKHKITCKTCDEVLIATENHTFDENGVCTACGAEAVARIIKASRATPEQFTTLQAAINAAEDGDTVEVMKDCTGAQLTQAKSITLNVPEGVTVSTMAGLNSKGDPYTYALVVANSGAELTITGEGTIQGSTYGVVAQSKGKLNVTSGTISGTYGIYAASNGTVNISGTAKVTGDPAVITTAAATVNVFGDAVVGGSAYGIQAQLGGHLNIYGNAKISGSDVAVYVRGAKTEAPSLIGDARTKVTISDKCVIEGQKFAVSGNGSSDGTIIEISGGTITSTSEIGAGIYHPQAGTLTITGGEITGNVGVQMCDGELNVSGANTKITATGADTSEGKTGDGLIPDGAAISLVYRGATPGSGYGMPVANIEDGLFTSQQAKVVATYGWSNATPGKTEWFPEKFISGGYFSDDLDAENAASAVYLADTYASHPVSTYEGYFHVHQPEAQEGWSHDDDGHWKTCSGHNDCLVIVTGKADHVWNGGEVTTQPTYDTEGVRTFTCDTCGHTRTEPIPALDRPTPDPDPEPDTTTYYTLTIRYVDAQGNQVAPTVTRRLEEGSRYTVDSPAVEGMTPDQETVTGILNSRTEITVTYAADENVDDNQTPTTEAPETSEPTESTEPTETQKPDETQPPETEEPGETEDLGENDTPLTETPDETEDLGDNDTPLADVPQTGDMLWLWILLAVVSASGLIWISLEEKKGRRVA